MEKPKHNITNWNAGGEYNDLIKTIKEEYFQAEIMQDQQTALRILNIDFDFSNSKILSEAAKKGETKSAEQNAQKIRIIIQQTKNELRKPNNPYNKHIIDQKISKIRQLIWDAQGKHGVLYPYETEKDDMSNKPTSFINQR